MFQLLSSVPEDEPLFQPFPPEINFCDYEPCEKYTAVFKLRNNDKVSDDFNVVNEYSYAAASLNIIHIHQASRQVKVVTTDPVILTVHQRYDQGSMDIGTSKVACGMEVIVLFSITLDIKVG